MKKSYKYFLCLILVLPAIIYFGFFFYYTVDAPINDDYNAILKYLNTHTILTQWDEKFDLFISQHNEHRIVYCRAWSLLLFKLTGTVNFNVLSFIGNLSLIPIAILLYKNFKLSKKPLLLFLPVMVLLFNLSFWENMTFAMAVLSNFTVILFALLTIWYLTVPNLNYNKVIIAALFFCFAIYTQGGGLLLLPVTLAVLLYRKEFKNLLLYILIISPAVIFYFYNFQQHGTPLNIKEILFDYKGRTLIFFLSFLGNGFNYFLIYSNQALESLGVTSIFGAGMLALFIYITITKYYKKNLFNYSIMLLIITIALVTALSRQSYGLETAGASRYRIIGVMFSISLYIWFVELYQFKIKHIAVVVATAMIYYLTINIDHYEYLSFRKRQTLKGMLFYNDGNNSYLNGDTQILDYYASILQKSDSLGIYTFPTQEKLQKHFSFSTKSIPLQNKQSTDYFTKSIDAVTELSDSYIVEGYGFLIGHGTANQKIFIGIKNEKDDYLIYFSSEQIPRYDLNPYFNKFNLKCGGYSARIRKEHVKQGENTLFLMIEIDGEFSVSETDKKIIIQ